MRRPATPIKQSDDSRKDWRSINTNGAAILALQVEVQRLREIVARNSGGKFVVDRHPFEVYTTPNFFRKAENRDADGWRKFKVRHGYVIDPTMVETEGCDDADGEGTTPEEITVPINTAAYYVWVDLDANEIGHGTVTPGGSFHLIARITTTDTQATIKQLQHDHIHPAGGAGEQVWL